MRIGVLNGPKLNLLGSRDPAHYGTRTLADIEALLSARASAAGADLVFYQSDDEAEIVDWLQATGSQVDGWLVNAGILTHSSVALRRAIGDTGRPFVEVHLSNVFAREPFRRRSVLADMAIGVVAGFRSSSYLFGLEALVQHLGEDDCAPRHGGDS